MKTFKNAFTDMVEIPEAADCDLIKHKQEKVDIEELESIITRYYKPAKKQNLFKEVELDLSNKSFNKKLGN